MAVTIEVPYGRGTTRAHIPETNLMGVYEAPGAQYVEDPAAEILRAIENPIGCEPLGKKLKPGQTVCIVVSDVTRPVPYKVMLPVLIKYLNEHGIEDVDITLLVATGLHRQLEKAEMPDLYGEEIVQRIRVVNHDYSDRANLTYLGETKYGCPIEVNTRAIESDILILTGYVEPHQQLGFTGGRKSVMPGISSERAVMFNHGAANMDNPHCVNGVLEDNPQHEDSLEVARAVGVDFIINVVLDDHKRLVKAFGGDLYEAWLEAAKLSGSMRDVVMPAPADVIITASGHPLDQVLYQGPKIASSAFRVRDQIVKDGGTIIVPMEATEGIGHHREFYDLMCSGTLEELIDRMYKNPIKDQWGAQIWVRMLQKVRMIIVTDKMKPEEITAMGIDYAPTLQAAMDDVLGKYGPSCQVAVFPRATTVMPRLAEAEAK